MNRMILLFFLAVLIIPSAAAAGLTGPARVVLVEGDVRFRTPDVEEWLPVSVNTPLDEGDVIWTPAGGRSELQLADGTVVRVDGGSQLDLLAVEDGFTHIHLASGRMYVRTFQKTAKNSLQIDADDTTVLPEARTRLRIDMLPNSQEDVAIFKGSAYVEGNGSRTKVRAGEHIALEEGHSELLPLNPPDRWEKWNNERDKRLSRTAGPESGLPDELRPYSAELDSNGSWVQVAEYGTVWRPTVILSSDWAPYRSGRWIWKQDDYVWISYESWGWVPYHFGRWAVVSGFGWCWIPPSRGDIYWGTGYVGWYRTGSHVGWTPLAPGETFYGHRHYGRQSVNITNTPAVSAAVAYRNRNERGGLSIVLQNDFLKGRAAFVNPSDNGAVSVSVSLGSPRIQPVRETRMPIIKKTPPRVAPPEVRRYDNHDLRVRFPRLAPEKDKPAIAQSAGSPTASTVPVMHDRAMAPVQPQQPQQSAPDSGQRTPSPPRTDRPTISEASRRSVEMQGPQTARPKELRQKKVWRVTTTDQANEKEPKEKEGREQHRGRK